MRQAAIEVIRDSGGGRDMVRQVERAFDLTPSGSDGSTESFNSDLWRVSATMALAGIRRVRVLGPRHSFTDTVGRGLAKHASMGSRQPVRTIMVDRLGQVLGGTVTSNTAAVVPVANLAKGLVTDDQTKKPTLETIRSNSMLRALGLVAMPIGFDLFVRQDAGIAGPEAICGWEVVSQANAFGQNMSILARLKLTTRPVGSTMGGAELLHDGKLPVRSVALAPPMAGNIYADIVPILTSVQDLKDNATVFAVVAAA